MEKKILVCGDRKWRDRSMIFHTLRSHFSEIPITIIHGDCRGADRIAGEIAEDLGYTVAKVPADWNKYGRAAGPIRNKQMLKFKPSLVIAFHDNISRSKGTRNMIIQTIQAGIDFEIYTYRHRDYKSENELKETIPNSWFA